MAKRKRIAFLFNVDSNWMGGTNYIINIISSFSSLPEAEQPDVVILSGSEKSFEYAKAQSGYPRLSYKKAPSLSKAMIYAKCSVNWFLRAARIPWRISLSNYKKEFDAIYPVFHFGDINGANPRLFWIPDFQEIHLPNFFTAQELKSRRRNNLDLLHCNTHIVVSSHDAQADFTNNYPAENANIHVLRFATKMPEVPSAEFSRKTLEKYGVKAGEYFFCANQIWLHKNHLRLFEAVKMLRDKGINIRLLCSGNNVDYRNGEYSRKVNKFYTDNNLSDCVDLLGLIDRKEQLALMQASAAILQPSLFEGWSTSIEEAKAMNKFLILSDLPVQKEQVTRNGWFFDRHSAADLADKLERFLRERPEVEPIDYRENIRQAAKDFMAIVDAMQK